MLSPRVPELRSLKPIVPFGSQGRLRLRPRRMFAVGASLMPLAMLVAYVLLAVMPADARTRKRAPQTPAAVSARSVPLPVRAPELETSATEVKTPGGTSAQAAQPHTPATLPAPPSSPVPLPEPAAESLDERVRAILDRHCARCHQAERITGRLAPNGGIANILALDEVARDPSLVRPGAPEQSPLYQQMIARQMPYDVLREGKDGPVPTSAELDAVRTWILKRDHGAACAVTDHVAPEDLVSAMTQWLEQAGPERAAQTRFVSLADIVNSCAGDADLAAVREAVRRLFNGLTWSPALVTVNTVGERLALLAVRLDELGWTAEHWDVLTASADMSEVIAVPEDVIAKTGARKPLVAAHWLADRVTDPVIYARLLGLPTTLDELAKILGLTLDDTREDRTVRRGVVINSAVSDGARVIERYPTPKSVLWVAHDYEHGDEKSAVLDHPLLPWAAVEPGGPAGEVPNSGTAQALFTLPNGMPAFMLFDSEGRAITEAMPPPKSEVDGEVDKPAEKPAEKAPAQSNTASRPLAMHRNQTVNGVACLSCHGSGVLGFEDRLQAHLAGDAYRGNAIARDIAREIVFSTPELEKRVVDDRNVVRRALAATGADANVRIDGHILVNGLARRYRRDLDLAAAAAEMMTTPDELTARLAKLAPRDGIANELAVRLVLDRLPRADFERLRMQLAMPSSSQIASTSAVALGAAADQRASLRAKRSEPTAQLAIWPDKPTYDRDDKVVLRARAAAACHLTLINIDGGGKATVLFPNEFDRDNLLAPGVTRRVPLSDAPYQFVLKNAGAETFVAICEANQPVPAGIRHDLTHQNFTALGDWNTFVDGSLAAAGKPRTPLENGDDIDRRRGPKIEKPKPVSATAQAQWRAAFTVKIAP